MSDISRNLDLLGILVGWGWEWFSRGAAWLLLNPSQALRPGLKEDGQGWEEAPDWDKRPGPRQDKINNTVILISPSLFYQFSEFQLPSSKTLEEGRCVGDGHRAVVRDGQQFVSSHGESVSVGTVTDGTDGEVEEVQLPVSQTLPENYDHKNNKNKPLNDLMHTDINNKHDYLMM